MSHIQNIDDNLIKACKDCIDIAYDYNDIEIIELLEKMHLTTFIIILQELYVYNFIDFSSFIDFNEYCY